MRNKFLFIAQLIIICWCFAGCVSEEIVTPTPIESYIPTIIPNRKPTDTPVVTSIPSDIVDVNPTETTDCTTPTPIAFPTMQIESTEIIPTATSIPTPVPTTATTIDYPQSAIYPVEDVPKEYFTIYDITRTYSIMFSKEYNNCTIETDDDTIIMTYRSKESSDKIITIYYFPNENNNLPALGTYLETPLEDRYLIEKTLPVKIPGNYINSNYDDKEIDYILMVQVTCPASNDININQNTVIITNTGE